MDIPTDNPAGRLYHLLSDARDQNPDLPTRQVWQVVFNSGNDDLVLADRLGKFCVLTHQASRAALGSVPGAKVEQLYWKCFEDIKTLVNSMSLVDAWTNSAQYLSDTTMLGLAYWAKELSGKEREAEISSEQLDELLAEVDKLSSTVAASDLDAELKTFIVGKLSDIRSCILDYRIRGSKSLEEAIEATIGGVAMRYGYYEKFRTHHVVKSFEAFVLALKAVVATATGAKELGGDLVKLLPWLNDK